MKEGTWRKRAWLRMWVEPKETIREIVSSDPKRGFLPLSIIYGLPIALNLIQSLALSTMVPLWAVLLGSLVLSPFLGMAGILVSAWLLEWAGRLLGGVGRFPQIRAAVTWSNLPGVVTIAMWLLLLGLFGARALDRDFAQAQFVGYQAGVLFITMLIEMVASIWGFVILLNTLSEVQRFSLWRAFFNVAIPFVAVVCVVWLLSWALYG